MYINLTRQSVPSQEYRELLGTAICVFNSNNAFVIENILHTNQKDYNWYDLIEKESGQLKKIIQATILTRTSREILDLFSELVEMRNRIIHSFLITDKDNEQRLATKTRVKDGNKQFVITEEYITEFIKKNETLCLKLHDYRISLRKAN
ncbi:MAG: selenium binding protein [Clostridiales bacterium]|nr:selenium binding protein [Clostridiales bacterium]